MFIKSSENEFIEVKIEEYTSCLFYLKYILHLFYLKYISYLFYLKYISYLFIPLFYILLEILFAKDKYFSHAS